MYHGGLGHKRGQGDQNTSRAELANLQMTKPMSFVPTFAVSVTPKYGVPEVR